MAHYPKKVYLNGEILDAENAKISVFDRGFLFGDGIYEVMLQINSNFFYGAEHLKRLAECLEKINIKFDVSSLPDTIEQLLQTCELEDKDCLLYIQVTRGIAPRKHSFPTNIEPTLLMYAIPFILPDINEKPISVVIAKDFRWHRCDIKMTSLLGNVMANDVAIKGGHYETVFYRDGKVTEASHSNIFFVKDGIVYTHPADENILNGITREIVIQLCRESNIPIQEKGILEQDINEMDEAFLTGTSTQIASIQKIDEHAYYEGNEPGVITKKLQLLFLELKNSYVS
ncbi:aminotransferase IV [Maribacter algarum]|uniref:Aminotransferase IV n=1 Tax=Maribacter algarum (ex Zhang et al. 2020) TaxID=2578118 RepID=A0A5S3Q9M9_9FLAO|nr:aminotransferase class IV [Maribacter algarum]TMM53753.1 aminotransferase IV [Maribacter algarum]